MSTYRITDGDSGEVVLEGLNDNFDEIDVALDLAPVSVTGAVTLDATAFGKLHICTGTSYTVGLPTAVGNTGKSIMFKGGLTLTGIATVDANSTETIDGMLIRALSMKGEFAIVSDGANWLIINEIPSIIPYTPTVTGFTSAPTVNAWYSLNGKFCTVKYAQSAAGTSNATTFTITLPGGMTGLGGPNLCIQVQNNGTFQAGLVALGASVFTVYATVAVGAFTASGNKNASFLATFEIS